MLHRIMQTPEDICHLMAWTSPDDCSFWTVTGRQLIYEIPFEQMRSGEISRLVIAKGYRERQEVDPVALWEWPDHVMRYVQYRLSRELEKAFMERVKAADMLLVSATYEGSALKSRKYAWWRQIFADRKVRDEAAKMETQEDLD